MKGLAALLWGATGFLAAGLVLGHPLTMRRPAPRKDRERWSDRQLRWLRQAGLTVTPAQFIAASVSVGLLTVAAVSALTGAWTVGLVPGGLASLAPRVYFGKRRVERLTAVTKAWPDGLRDLAASVNAGLPLHRALIELAATGPGPLRDAFSGYPATARTMGVGPALEKIKEEVADPATDRVVEILILAHARGPENLGAILDELAASVARDMRTAEEIETSRQEPRINMAAAATVPWALLLITCLGDTPHRTYYASGRGVGPVLLSALLTFGGMVAVRALARDPIEQRLFAGTAERPR